VGGRIVATIDLPKTRKEADDLVDFLTQTNYNYNRTAIKMSAEDLAVVFGKEQGAKLERNYQRSLK
jgi:hypothetical protein